MKSNQELLDQFEQGELFYRFADEPDFFCKKMFGGLSCYYSGRMVACLVEGDWNDTKWKGKDYRMPLWRGLLIPTDHKYHESLQSLITSATQHPILKKWLYLSIDSDAYDDAAKKLIYLIAKQDIRVGVEPKNKKRKSTKKNNRSGA